MIKIDPNIFKKHQVKLAYLFGSRAKGNAVEESDYDVAILFEKETDGLDFLDRAAYLKEDLRPYFPNEVEVVPLNEADSILKYEVISNGQVLYSYDEGYRVDFEVAAITGYIDDRHTLDIYYAALEKRVNEGVF